MCDVFTKILARNQGGMRDFLHHTLVVSANNHCRSATGYWFEWEVWSRKNWKAFRLRALRKTEAQADKPLPGGHNGCSSNSIFVLGKLSK